MNNQDDSYVLIGGNSFGSNELKVFLKFSSLDEIAEIFDKTNILDDCGYNFIVLNQNFEDVTNQVPWHFLWNRDQ
jgi:hypothetical protein